jgi:uncharacterized protein involved in exopolysaccharide biosynthesis
MEAELDLRPIVRAVVRRWWLILLVGLGCALIAIGAIYMLPAGHSASADVLVIPRSSRITLDERFVTSDVAQVSNPTLQREGLIALGTSNTLERLALSNLPAELRTQYAANGSLIAAMKVETQGDLLRFTAQASTDEQAQLLAETWAKSYQQLVDELFNVDVYLLEQINAQLVDVQQRYNEAQVQLEEFVATSNLAELEQRVQNLQTLLSNAAAADQQLYSDYLERVRVLDLIVADAQTLRDQLAIGSVDEFGNALTLLSLRTRAAGVTDLPVEVQLTTNEGLAQNGDVTIEQIDQIVNVLQQRRTDLYEQAQTIARSLASGDGELIGLAGQVRARYIKELSELVRQREEQLSQQRLLEERRNIAFESLKLLQSKSDEQTIARGSPQVEVRFISASIDPPVSVVRRILFNGALGLVGGLGLGLAIVLCVDVLRPALQKLLRAAPAEPALRSAKSEPTATS